MKKFLLTVAALATFMGVSAQATYNYFDAEDVDANGWLWFDTQAKIDKYVGWGNPFGANPKIILLTDDIMDSYAEPECNPDAVGYNAAGEQGGEGAKNGAIILPGGSSTFGSDKPNGGGIMMQLPDCAEIDIFFSTENNCILLGLFGAAGKQESIDCGLIKGYMKMFSKPLASVSQYEWNNVQDVENGVTKYSLKSDSPVTAMIRNNMKTPLYIQGIKVMTYTKSSDSSAGIDDVIDGAALKLSVNEKEVFATEDAAISVYSAAGSKVAEVNGASLSLENLAPGAYVVKAVSGNGTATIKVVR